MGGQISRHRAGEGAGPQSCASSSESVKKHKAVRPAPSDPPPPADGRCYMDNLPSAIVVTICSYLTYEWRALERYAVLCRGFRGRLDDDAVWQHLCSDFWFVEEEHFSEWPKITSWRALYRILEQWAVLEGYYTLPTAFPWCMLALLRFEAGALVAEAVRFCQQWDDAGTQTTLEVHARLFQVSFSEEAEGVRAALGFPGDTKGLLSGRGATVGPLPNAVGGSLMLAQAFKDIERVVPRWITAARGFTVALGGGESGGGGDDCGGEEGAEAAAAAGARGGDMDTDSEEDIAAAARRIRRRTAARLLGGRAAAVASAVASAFGSGVAAADNPFELWEPGALEQNQDAKTLEEVTARMVYQLLAGTGTLPFALVRSPVEYKLDDPLAPHLRPGLYVGDYGHSIYGQFRHEVILVEFRECTPTTIRGLFARPFGEGIVPPELTEALAGVDNDSCSFLVGTKVTGDVHVPAGQTTFVALVGPRHTKERLDEARGVDLRLVRNRSTGQQERIRSTWPGFGTLAMPVFHGANWAPGWLVRLEPTAGQPLQDASADRFGFMWDRNQDTVVLEYIRAQTSSPFLNRKWLPEGLR